MNLYLIVLVSVIYFLVGINYLVDKNVGMFIAFICYAIANVGLYLGAK